LHLAFIPRALLRQRIVQQPLSGLQIGARAGFAEALMSGRNAGVHFEQRQQELFLAGAQFQEAPVVTGRLQSHASGSIVACKLYF
jgi:hypothetical protein